jgi:signal transduction histidine kinase
LSTVNRAVSLMYLMIWRCLFASITLNRYRYIVHCFLVAILLVSLPLSVCSQQRLWPAILKMAMRTEACDTDFLPDDLPLDIQTDYDILDVTRERYADGKIVNAIRNLAARGEAIQWQHSDSAMRLFDSCLQKSLAIGYNTGAANAMLHKALTVLGQGRFDEGRNFFKKAFPYTLLSSNKQMMLSALYINMGASYGYQSNFQKAFEYYYAILQYMLKHPADYYNLIMTYNNIADVLIHMEQYEKATYYLNIGEQLMMKQKDESIYPYIWVNRADLALAFKHYELSAWYRKKALDCSIKYKMLEVQQSIFLIEAKDYLARDQPQKAITSLKKSMSISDAGFPLYSLIGPYYYLGLAYYKAHDYSNAEKVLVVALEKAHKTGIMTDKLKALATLTSVYIETGHYKEAMEQQQQYITIQDSINNKEKLKIANELEVKFRIAEKDKKIIEKELLIEKQKRDLDHKSQVVSRTLILAIVIVLICIGLYWSLKAKNRIITMKAQMEGEENERSRIARELHDGIGGQLAVIKMIVSSWPDEKKKQVVTLLNDTSEQVRQTAHNLMPDFIKGVELEEALTLYVETLNHNFPRLKIDLQMHGHFHMENQMSKLSVYRMLQELLQNIINHAEATLAVVQIFEQHGKLHLLIEDNGRGFDRQRVKMGLGISNVEARVKMLQGKIQIHSSPGRGTTVNIELSKL